MNNLKIMDNYLLYLDFDLGFDFAHGGNCEKLCFSTDDKYLIKKIKTKAKKLGLKVRKKSGEYLITA
ncbi:hypothetical protein [Nautilia sp.]